MNKYRVHEVAKDFKMTSKAITQILTDYATTPKNHMQVLEEPELDVIFEYLTQHNQINDIAEIYAEGPAPGGKKEAEQKAAPPAAQKPQQSAKQDAQPKSQPQTQPQPQQSAQPQQRKPQQAQQGAQQRRVPEKRVIDTRGATATNLDKYDEKFDNMAGERAQKMRSGKEKFTNKNKARQQQNMSAKRRQEERERQQRQFFELAKKAPVKVSIPDEISVGELASRMKKSGAEVVKKLMSMGVFASVSEMIDYDTAALVAMELGCKVEKEVVVTVEERLIDDHEDKPEELVPRAPVVVVMGHVDHGKTSLLDYIRRTNVASGEAGGITQHIGAYRVDVGGQKITFLDTPGHAAFTAMRARGAQATDIAVLVVAADDGIMPQTIEAINHAKAADVSIIVAINKMDKPGASTEKIMQQLTEYELIPEEWGGDVICVPVSAKTGMNIDKLLESILLVAEMKELKANPNRPGKGVVIEARLDKGRGPVATLLVQNGMLKAGDTIVAGMAVGRVRVMTNDRGQRVETAGPSVHVEITGLVDVPQAGDAFDAVSDERLARELVEQRKHDAKEEEFKQFHKVTLDNLFASINEGEVKELDIIVKADVQGSVEAVRQSLEKLSNDEVHVKVIHGGVGAVSESDVMLANASNAIIVGFNVRPDPVATQLAERDGIDMRMYRVIYDCIEEIEAAIKGMLAPKYREVQLGRAEVRNVFKLSSAGTIAGSYVLDGKITRNAQIRVVRDGVVITEDAIASLKRFKDDVKEVAQGYECGVGLEKFNDIKEGDVLEAFVMEEYRD